MLNESSQIENDEIEIDLENLFLNFIAGIKKFGIILLCFILIYTGFRYIKAKRNYHPLYRCEATFAVSANGDDVTELVKTYSHLLTGSMMKDVVAEDLQVESIPAMINVVEVKDTNFLLLQVTSNDADMGYQVTNSILKNFNSTLNLVTSDVDLEVIIPPDQNNEPINASNHLHVAKVSLLQSGGASIVILGLYALLRRTVQSGKDFKRCLHINYLGAIPFFKFKKRSHKIDERLLVNNPRISQDFIDSYKSLRRRIENVQLQKNHKVFLITSCAPNEGKTTIALNLAISLAQKEKKVLLIDGDLRTCAINQMLSFTVKHSLVDIIKDKRLDENDAVSCGIKNLKVLGGLKKVNNSSEVLSSEFLPKLIAYYKERFDYVIVDSAPIGLLGDGKIIARYCDGAVVVVRQDKIRDSLILRDIEKLDEEGIDIIGGVLNGAKRHFKNYGYYNKYYNYRYSKRD